MDSAESKTKAATNWASWNSMFREVLLSQKLENAAIQCVDPSRYLSEDEFVEKARIAYRKVRESFSECDLVKL